MKKDFKNIIVLTEIDSTNNYANQLISDVLPKNGTVVLALYQRKGRGQRENYWESGPGKNLLASIIVYPSFLPVSKQFYLSKIASLTLIRWLSDKNVHASIKWPNDIYIENKKIAGILIETSIKGDSFFSGVVGIGLNLNQTEFSSELPNPVSLKMVNGIEYTIPDAAGELREIFMQLYLQLQSGAYDEIDSAYFNHLFCRNKWTWYKEGERLHEARIVGIGQYGQLLLENRSGQINSYFFKEIQFVI